MIKAFGFDGPQHKDGSYCYIDTDVNHLYHFEAERYTRVKEGPSDGFLQAQHDFTDLYDSDLLCMSSHITKPKSPTKCY